MRLRGLCRLPLVLATVGLASIIMTGCQCGHGHQAVELHYGRLEQACFGYEPTVWRNMASECTQAVRMIPDEVVQLPPAAPAPTPAPAPAAPAPSLLPLETVPEPGQDSPELPGLLHDIEPSAEPPAEMTPPPATEPLLPDALPETDIAPPAEPADAPAPAAGPPLSRRSNGTRVIPVVQLQTPRANPTAARALFESLEQALDAADDAQDSQGTAALKSARTSSPDKPGTVGLARFISY